MTKRNFRIVAFFMMILLVVSLTGCMTDTSYPGTLNIVEASQVIESANSPGVIVIDARGQEAYDKGHLKGAICLSPDELVVEAPVPKTLVDQATFESILSKHGISNDSVVYIYDDNGGVSAGRIWWTLRVYGHTSVMIVNGGASELVKAKAELTVEPTVLPETSYTASVLDTSQVASFEEVKAVTEDAQSKVKLLDVRSSAEFAEGHIPGAILYPHTQNLYKDGTFMSSRDLKLFYQDAGFSVDDEIILYCKSSYRATQAVALLEEAGFKNLKVYDGAWIEWSSLMDTTEVQEDTAPVGESDGS